jgi:predicted regulator of Ras-like GTPase activity (Roadblock/LC7/MglB family)
MTSGGRVKETEQPPETKPASRGDLGWLLDDLVSNVAAIDQAVILSRDGLVVGSSNGLSREDAEQLAAMASGFHSLARGASVQYNGGGVRQTIIEMEHAFLFVTASGRGSCLAVLAPAKADVGLVAYEMAVLVKRLGPHLMVEPRPGSRDAAE